MTAFRLRGRRAWGPLALTFVLVVAASGLAAAQVNVQQSGTVESIDGQTMTLLTNAPPRGPMTMPQAQGPRPPVVVDLAEVPASQYVFLRPGDRIAVVGLPSADGRRFAAIAIIGGSRPPPPQAP